MHILEFPSRNVFILITNAPLWPHGIVKCSSHANSFMSTVNSDMVLLSHTVFANYAIWDAAMVIKRINCIFFFKQ